MELGRKGGCQLCQHQKIRVIYLTLLPHKAPEEASAKKVSSSLRNAQNRWS